MLDYDQYIDLFLDESREHLQNLNECLMEFENDRDNIEIVNEIFRIAHTLKGMSATMGYDILATLTHKMENLFDGIRSHKLKASQEVIDTLFDGLDILEGQVKSVENEGKEQKIDISDIMNRLDILEKGGTLEDGQEAPAAQAEEKQEEKQEKSSASIFSNIPKQDREAIYNSAYDMVENNGDKLYLIKVKIQDSCVLKSARAFMVFRALEEEGEIIYSNPGSEDIEDGKFENNFSVLYITEKNPEQIKEAVDDILEIESVEITEYDLEDIIDHDEEEHEEEKAPEEQKQQEAPKAENKPAPPRPAKAGGGNNNGGGGAMRKKSSKSVRVDIDRLDNLMNLVSELIIVKTRLEDSEIFSKPQNMTEAIEYLERVTTNIHDAVTKVRMVPIERVFNRFPRMIRDLSKELEKEINLIMLGEETEVDRTVIDEIGDPLIHLLRNSIDHGIEMPQERIALGKPEEGTVKLIAYPDGNTVVIEVSDDGAGINVDKVKQKAIERGIITAEQANDMDTNKAAELIFAPGFSTSDKISDISGRGVGLDVVKTKIESLNGTVEVVTEKDKGSSFIIRLPLTLAIIQALLIVIGGEKYAIPLNNIKEISDINTEDIRVIENQEIILYRDTPLELVRLSEVLDCEVQERKEGHVTVVIVRKGEKDLGLIIDELIGQQEIVIKSLGSYLSFVKQIAGATILGNGGVALIIDTNSLFV